VGAGGTRTRIHVTDAVDLGGCRFDQPGQSLGGLPNGDAQTGIDHVRGRQLPVDQACHRAVRAQLPVSLGCGGHVVPEIPLVALG
jgi:hypothetical protein